jgi:hypothetical protein
MEEANTSTSRCRRPPPETASRDGEPTPTRACREEPETTNRSRPARGRADHSSGPTWPVRATGSPRADFILARSPSAPLRGRRSDCSPRASSDPPPRLGGRRSPDPKGQASVFRAPGIPCRTREPIWRLNQAIGR